MTGLFFEWVFLYAPASFFKTVRNVSIGLTHYFSIPLLLTSLFAPWRKDATSLQNAPANAWGQIILNNAVSRFIGFIVRGFTILLGLVSLFVWNVGAIIFFICWYCLPFFLIASILYGVRLILGI
jgi:hypothetical protein